MYHLRGLFIYNAVKFPTPYAAFEAGALNCVDGTEEQLTVGELSDILNSVSKTLTFTKPKFTVAYVYDGFYINYLGDAPRDIYPHELARVVGYATVKNPIFDDKQMLKAGALRRLVDQLPFMADLLSDTAPNPKLSYDIETAGLAIAGKAVSICAALSLDKFIQECEQ